jgi:plastocyanin
MKLNSLRPATRVPAVLVLALALTVAAGATTAVARTFSGSVGPGFTITLKSGGKKVTSVKAGTHKIRVSDKSSIHNFRIKGPGVNRRITTVGFTGTKTVTLKLRKGTYRYVCDPHASSMRGSFRVN